MGLMTWIWQGLLGCAKTIAFPFAKLGCPSVRPYVRWTAHVIAVVAILGCLTWLNAALELDKVVRAPLYWLRMLWLPLLFVFIYSLAWVAWWLWRVATSPAEQSPYPELDLAWREGLQALEQAKIDLLQTPVYLLIGGADAGVEGITQATGWQWDVPLTPKRAGSLRLCATRDAIFLDLTGTSTSGAYTHRLLDCTHDSAVCADATVPSLAGAALTEGTGGVATAIASRRTVQRGLELIEQSLALLEEEKATQAKTESPLDGVRITEEELEAAEARLAYVCHLLAAERAPYCPANGIVTLIAWEATATHSASQRTAVLIDRDLQIIGDELKIAAPRLAIVTDIDAAVGASDLIARVPADQRQRRFGVRFPRLAATDVGMWPQCIHEGLAWLAQELLPAMAYRLLRTGSVQDTDQSVWRGNASIFRFLSSVREREQRLVRLLERGMLPSLGNTSLGGLFFSANRLDDPQRQAFLAGVMPQLLEMQNDVAWTSQAIEADRRARHYTAMGYLSLLLVIATLIACAVAAS